MLKRILALWLPFEEGDPEEPSNTDGRPPYVPEKFWDHQTGKVNIESMSQAYVSLEGKIRESEEQYMARAREQIAAQAPEKYEVRLPEDFKAPEGVTLNLNPDDPLVSWFSGFAKQAGLTQEQFDKAVAEYVATELSLLPDPTAQFKALGDKAQERIKYVQGVLTANLGESEYNAIAPAFATAEGVMAFEKLFEKFAAGGPEGRPGDNPVDPMPTDDDIKAMMDDIRYFQDPNYRAMVTRKWQAKYAGQKKAL